MSEQMKQFKVVVIGSINVDLVVKTTRNPLPGETLLGDSFNSYPGGKGSNQAVMCSKFGTPTFLVGCFGDDDFGKISKQWLSLTSVDISISFTVPNITTGIAIITISQSTGENSILVVSGANSFLNCYLTEDTLAKNNLLVHSSVIACQNENGLELVDKVFNLADNNGTICFWNCAPAPSCDQLENDAMILNSILKKVDFLCVNEIELDFFVKFFKYPNMEQINYNDDEAINKILQFLCPFIKHGIIITRGSYGATYLYKSTGSNIIKHVHPSSKVKCIDSTGAGDAFVGSFLHFLNSFCSSNYTKPVESLQKINSSMFDNILQNCVDIATDTVTKIGAQSSYPSYEDISRIIGLNS